MNIVLDTNVLVSGLLTPFGSSGEIIRMISAGELILCIDARILSEYQEVLNRPKFQFSSEHTGVLIDFIKMHGQLISSLPLDRHLPDPDDEPFLEVAIAGKVQALITGNSAHFPLSSPEGVRIFSPTKFLEYYRKQNKKKNQDG